MSLEWIKKAYQSRGGGVSSSRIVASIVAWVYVGGRINLMCTCSEKAKLYALALDAVFILVLYGIVKTQSVIEFWRGYKKEETQ
jgi:hypothetical protein